MGGSGGAPGISGVEGYDVYNPTAPFSYQGKNMICARVEKRDSEISQAVFFEETEKDIYRVAEGWERYNLQDPSITRVLGQYVLGAQRYIPTRSTRSACAGIRCFTMEQVPSIWRDWPRGPRA